MEKYVIGVDTGATKSHLALFDTEAHLVDLGLWGPLNYEIMPGRYTQFEEELEQFISRVLAKNGVKLEQVVFAVFGVAGVDTKKQHSVISQIISRIGFRHFILYNDAFLGIPAGNPAGFGICAINGSGCTLAGINKEGAQLQIGGVGAISADMGGGGYLGERAAAAAYCELFRKGEKTLMTPMLFDKLGITSKYDFIEKLYENSNNGFFNLSSYNKIVFEAVKQGDPVAVHIFREVADCYSNGIACMIEELRFPSRDELPIILAGSVFVKGEHPLMVDTLKTNVLNSHPGRNITFQLLDVPNVAGAVIWALNVLDNKNRAYDTVCAQLREAQQKVVRITS